MKIEYPADNETELSYEKFYEGRTNPHSLRFRAGLWLLLPYHRHSASTPWLCLLQDAGSQHVGFLLGSCGVTLALTTDACQKGLPKAPTGEVATFKGEAPQSRFCALGCAFYLTWPSRHTVPEAIPTEAAGL